MRFAASQLSSSCRWSRSRLSLDVVVCTALRCHLLRVSLADGARAVATFLLAHQAQDALDIG
jgi:hypothetical protein